MYRVGPRKLREHVIDVLDAGLVPMIEGPPGSGKSSIVASIADDALLDMTDHRVSTSAPEDFNGLPRFDKDGNAYFAPFADIFPLATRKVPEGKRGFMLFLDEFTSGKEDVQAAAYKPLLDHTIGQHPLHPLCAIVAAGNRMEDRAIVNELGTALQSRLIWLELEVVFREWLEDVAIKEEYDHRIIAYLNRYQDKLMDFRPDHTDKTFRCPRTWSFMNKLIKGKTFREIENPDGSSSYEMDDKASLYNGTIGASGVAEFIRFTRIGNSMPEIADILADPQGLEVPGDMNLMYITVSYLQQNVTEDTLVAIGEYVNRFDMTFKIMFFRAMMLRFPHLRHHPTIVQAQVQLSRYLS